MINRETLIEELSPFSDIGETTPKITEKDGKFTIRMARDGRPLKVILDTATGKTQTTFGATPTRNHASFAAMLASEVFANLKRWADIQREFLKQSVVAPKKLIPINGKCDQGKKILEIDQADALIGQTERPPNATEILLIDGPAGIGKTNLIEQLALMRAERYKTSPCAVILHVKSRGRVLSNIQDLMAFSLQTLRSNITYDQIPILARYGLVIIAIDGFDELGDPNGYELAWAQLGELVSYVRGAGTIILSGRDTFVGRARLIKDVHAIRDQIDVVTALTLDVPTANQAKEWLKGHQWTDATFKLPAISVLIEDDSFALRPVFLRLLGENIKPKLIRDKNENYLTAMLVTHMIEREAKLFGKAVDSKLSPEQLHSYVLNFLYEAARDMADSQTESLDENTLSWIAETALGDGYPDEIVGLIKNRSNVIAFLVPDERPGYRKFINSQLMNFFLAHVTIDAIGRGDVPKFVRRNLIGSEFLSVFIDVVAEEMTTSPSKITQFLLSATRFAQLHTYVDRGIRNVGALLFSALPYFPSDQSNLISGYQVDEAVLRGTSVAVQINEVMINQVDCRGADLTALSFSESNIINVIGDDSSRFSSSFPLPKFITDGSGRQLSDPVEIMKWLDVRGRNAEETSAGSIVPHVLQKHPIYKLLGRVCRLRQYWLRAEDDVVGMKIFQDENWAILLPVLRKYGFLREESRQASGRPSAFVHVKQRERILSESKNDADLASFFKELAAQV